MVIWISANCRKQCKHGAIICKLYKRQLCFISACWLKYGCFSLTNENLVSDFLNKMNVTAKAFMTSTFYNRKKGIRAAFVNYRTTAADIDFAKTEMLKILTEL